MSLKNTGAIAPTAYTRSGSARIFPHTVTSRGRLSGTYVGRARPNYETAIASCDCLSNARGFWDSSSMPHVPEILRVQNVLEALPRRHRRRGAVLWLRQVSLGKQRRRGRGVLSKQVPLRRPRRPLHGRSGDCGRREVEEFELYVKAQFNGLPPSESFEDPRNYNFASSSCSGCKEGFGGLNCASTCSYCLFGGSCSFTPSTTSISVPCNCIGQSFDPYNSCCPSGFTMLESLVHNDVGLLTTTLRRKRLTMDPGENVAVGTFF